MDWKIVYFNESVQSILNAWPAGLRAVYARITERIAIFGPNLGMPFTRALGHGLFEIRVKGKEGIGRAFFCTIVAQKVIVLHAYIKKSAKTPRKELEIARKRQEEVKRENTPRNDR